MKCKLLSLVLASAVALSSASALAANSSKQAKQTHHNSSNSMNMMKGQSHTSPGGVGEPHHNRLLEVRRRKVLMRLLLEH